jgi:hypothetical protein
MSLKIDLIDVFQLRLAAPRQLPLPRINLKPDGPGSPPHLVSVKTTVTGQPSQLARAVQAAYPSPVLKTPLKLIEARPLVKDPMAAFDGPLPRDANLQMVVEATYYDSDALGQPILTEPGPKNKLVSALRSVRQHSLLQTRPPQPPTLEVTPYDCDVQILLTTGVRAEPAIITIKVNNPIAGSIPRMVVRTPDAVRDPETRQVLIDTVQSPLVRQSVRESDGQETYVASLELRLTDASKQALAKETNARPLTIGLAAELPGPTADAAPLAVVEHQLTLRCDEGDFPGWLAIDFGTSNSTVTIYDKSEARQLPVPRELDEFLRQKLIAWIGEQAADAVPGCSEQEWKMFREEVARGLQSAGQGLERLRTALGGTSTELLDAVRRIEVSLIRHPNEQFRRAGFSRLNDIYAAAFRVPCLSVRQMFPAELSEHGAEIVSEIAVKSLDRPLLVEMGPRVHQERLASIALAQSNGEPIDKVRDRYHPSPKRYFCRDRRWHIELGGAKREVEANELVQAAWGKLIDLANAYRRQPGSRIAPGRFRTVIVTYPTAAPPEARIKAEQLVAQLGVKKVQTDYDEAISAAVFHTMREFGGDVGSGLDAFKARCSRRTEPVRAKNRMRWSLNLLVLDIGGGTTDLALIRLELEERDPFADGEDRGAGGRYYVITPELLGSTGHPNLGGELLTLRIFHLLKAWLADRVLRATADGVLRSPTLERLVGELRPELRDKGGYRRGSIPQEVVKGMRSGSEIEEGLPAAARDAAEKVFPTRWHNDSRRLQTFYSLWDLAEQAKIDLGSKKQVLDMPVEGFVVPGDQVMALLRQVGVTDTQLTGEVRELRAELPFSHFEEAINPIVREAVELANSFVESRLSIREDKHKEEDRRRGGDGSNVLREQLDWLILSGKTCKLQSLRREIGRLFSRSKYFEYSPEKVTFAEDYAKLATSIGACWAEQLRTSVYGESDAKDVLRRGFNQLRFDVKNLFFNLPCSLVRAVQGGYVEVFRTGEELKQLDFPVPEDGQRLGKARSSWKPGLQQEIDLSRKDFEGQDPLPLWVSFKVKDGLGFTNDAEYEDFVREMRIQFEVDHKLRVRLFLCRGTPHYQPVYSGPGAIVLDVKSALGKLHAEAPESSREEVDELESALDYEIAVGISEGVAAGQPDSRQTVFRVGTPLDQRFHLSGDVQRSGAISLPLPPFRRTTEGRYYHDFFLGRPGFDTWYLIGSVERPRSTSEYPCDYHATIDSEGYLTISQGEIPYRMPARSGGNLRGLLSPTLAGMVVALDPVPKAEKIDTSRDPYSGTH